LVRCRGQGRVFESPRFTRANSGFSFRGLVASTSHVDMSVIDFERAHFVGRRHVQWSLVRQRQGERLPTMVLESLRISG
jgi:hypothetical protein